jgi:hypothetical protein
VGFVNKGVSSTQSSVDQVITPLSGYNYTITPGSAFTPANYTLRHPCNGYTSNQGNSQQLPNGNMLVCMAFLGTVYEINPAGTTIWSKNVGGTLVHAYRYSDCYINTSAPALPYISSAGGVLVSTSAVTYQWYLNGTAISGATTQSYMPTQTGNYLVRVTDANNCGYYYSATVKQNVTTGVQTLNADAISVYPNPSTGIINIDIPYAGGSGYTVMIYDNAGKLVMSRRNENKIDLSHLDNGFYLLSVRSDDNSAVSKKITLMK